MFITLGGQEDPNCMCIIIEKKTESTEHTHAQDYTFCNCIVSEMQKHEAHALASHNTHKSTSHRHNSYLCNVKQCNMISQSPYYSIQWQPHPNCIEWQWPGGKKRQTSTNHLLASKLNDIPSNLQECEHYSTNCTFGLQESSIAQCISCTYATCRLGCKSYLHCCGILQRGARTRDRDKAWLSSC